MVRLLILSKSQYEEMINYLSTSSVYEMNIKYGHSWAKNIMNYENTYGDLKCVI